MDGNLGLAIFQGGKQVLREPQVDRRGRDWNAEAPRSTSQSALARHADSHNDPYLSNKPAPALYSYYQNHSSPPALIVSPTYNFRKSVESLPIHTQGSPSPQSTQKRRASLTQVLGKTFSLDPNKKLQWRETAPPLPANAAAIIQHAKQEQQRQPQAHFVQFPDKHKEKAVRSPAPPSSNSLRKSSNEYKDKERRPSLFATLRNLVSGRSSMDSNTSAGSRKSSNASRKGSKDSSRRGSNRSPFAILSTGSRASPNQSYSSPRISSPRPIATRNTHPGSPLRDVSLSSSQTYVTASLYSKDSQLTPTLSHKSFTPIMMQSHRINLSPPPLPVPAVLPPPELRPSLQVANRVESVDSVYDYYGDDTNDQLEPDSLVPSMIETSSLSSQSSSMALTPEEPETPSAVPVWATAGFGSSDVSSNVFRNPWGLSIEAAGLPSTFMANSSESPESPGGRRSSYSSSVYSSKRNTLGHVADFDLKMFENNEEASPRFRSQAAQRRASLAASVIQQEHQKQALAFVAEARRASIGNGEVAALKLRKNRQTGLINGQLLQAGNNINPVTGRKSSLVLPGDLRLGRRKSSLSVTFNPLDSEQQPLRPPSLSEYHVDSGPPKRPPSLRRTSNKSQLSKSAIAKKEEESDSCDSTVESDLEMDHKGDDDVFGQAISHAAPCLFELRNPWTGKSVSQPINMSNHRTREDRSPSAGSSRRPTILPSTPHSAKSGSIASMSTQVSDEWSKPVGRNQIRQNGPLATGLRVSLDFNGM